MKAITEKSLRVWRIENKYGLGPYNMSSSELEQLIGSHFSGNGHPAPINDKGIMRYVEDDELCGFLNLKQVYEWFTKEEIDELNYEGYVLKIVSAKCITAVGEKQILFKRR